MKGYFTYNWTGGNSCGSLLDVNFLIKSPGVVKSTDLADAIEAGLQGSLYPDVVAIVCLPDEVASVLDAMRFPVLIQARLRASNKVCICVCAFDKLGNIKLVKPIVNNIPRLKHVFEEESGAILHAGLEKLFEVPHVLVSAPPGFTFLKPSQARSTQFLRAEEALSEIESVHFLAFSLLPKLLERDGMLKNAVDTIYVDSMAIASVAYALRELYCDITGHARPRVESFHSHDGLNCIHAPPFGTSFTIISASTSMNLGRLWKIKTGCHSAEVLTLLTLRGAVGWEEALYAKSAEGQGPASEVNSHVLKDLPIVGERFVPEQLLPKKVLLRRIEHQVQIAANFSEKISGFSCVSIQARSGGPNGRTRPIFIKGNSLLENCEFKKFLQRVLLQKVVASTRAIIHQDDEASEILAKFCREFLREELCLGADIPIFSQIQLENGEVESSALDKRHGLLIVGAVVGRGTKLLSISRELRSLHDGARTYLIGVQLTAKNTQIGALNGNLKQSASGANISVESYTSIAVGEGLSDSFVDEYAVLRELGNESLEFLATRTAAINGSILGMREDVFIGAGEQLDLSLKLRPDFAYWSTQYDENGEHQACVFLMIAAILQGAREGRFTKPELRLATDAFQQVMLDPENFARFNDGVIQSAILRAAHRSELDYSRDNAASEHMLEILVKIFKQHGRAQGEAALEFAISLRTERLKLTVKHREKLAERVSESLAGEGRQKKLLRKLLLIDSPALDGSLPSGF